jgi:transposase InsO family protein
MSLVAIRPRKRHYYPDAGTRHKKAENLLNREFEQQTLNTFAFAILYKCVCTVLHALIGVKHQCVGIRLVVGDITYIKTYQGWSYLASVLDLSSKQVVGWALLLLKLTIQ